MKPEIRPTRATRRVLLVLLTGAEGLSGYPLSRLSQVNSGRVYIVLGRLERAGWADGEWEQRYDGKPRRRFYHLTRQGRAKAIALLGLEMPDE
jgi:PadR family transcriptional regulator, regulatory protein PadR